MSDIKRIFNYVKPYKGNIFKAVVCNIFYAFFSLFTLGMIVPFISVLFGLIEPITTLPQLEFSIQYVVNLLSYCITFICQKYSIVAALFFISGLFLACSLISNLFRYLYWYFITPINANTVRDIRQDLFDKVLILPLSYYTKVQTGDIITRLNADMQEVDTLVRRTIEITLQQPLVIIVFLITLFITSPWLTLLALTAVPLVSFFVSKITKKIKQKSKIGQEELSHLSANYEESISGLRVIKGYNGQKFFFQKFRQTNRSYTRNINKVYRYVELSAPLSEILTIFALLLVVFAGSYLVFNQKGLSSQSLILFSLVFARLIPPIQSCMRAYNYIQKGLISTRRIFEVLDSDEKIIEKPNALPLPSFEQSIEFKHVDFAYEDKKVIEDLNLTIKKGDKIAIVGNSGGGKTSIINLLLRLYDISGGELLIDGKRIDNYIISDVRALFAMVSQEVLLFNDTVWNNIAFGKGNVSEEAVVEAAKRANAHNFILQLEKGYQSKIGDRGMMLSGGQRQRISIARAILNNPPILLLDEATSSLDSESEQIIQQAFEEIMKDETAIVIAHRLATIKNMDTIIVLQQGKIVEQGNHEELMALKGEYYQLAMAQNK